MSGCVKEIGCRQEKSEMAIFNIFFFIIHYVHFFHAVYGYEAQGPKPSVVYAIAAAHM